jgi:5,10-methylene-tetrahydrofolate dehydrogenase/methenyl tetrahydrofolate cyclohydrolase
MPFVSISLMSANCEGVVLAAAIAKKFIDEIMEQVSKLDPPPKLVGFLANADPAAKMYADFTKKTSLDCGFRFETREVNKEDLEDAIMDANEDKDVDGIMVYFPVFGDRQVHRYMECRLNAGSIFTTMYTFRVSRD